jgi:hypothetical protein
MRHIAYEGRCFAISACQYLTCSDCPTDFEPAVGKPPDTALICGGSMIVSPFGEVLPGLSKVARGQSILFGSSIFLNSPPGFICLVDADERN